MDGLERSESNGGQAQPDLDGRQPEGAKPESQARLIASVEALWKSVKVCRDVYSGAMTTLNLLTAEELDDVFHGRQVGNGAIEYMLEEYRDIRFVNSKTHRIGEQLTGVEELFVSERLWALYGRIVQIHGRMAVLFHRSFERGSYVDWRKDKATLSMMSAFLDDKRLTAATTRTIGGMNEVVEWLSREFVKEARNLLRDPQSAHAMLGRVSALAQWRRDVLRPALHQFAPPVEQIAAEVDDLDGVGNPVSKRRLNDLARTVCTPPPSRGTMTESRAGRRPPGFRAAAC